MVFISITRLRIRKWYFLPAFLYFTFLSVRQARRVNGNLHTSVFRDAGLTFWTITVWRDEASMRAFRNTGAHRRVMPKLLDWCDEATYAHWLQAEPEPPELPAAYERLIREGIVSKVRQPTAEHASRHFPPPRQ